MFPGTLSGILGNPQLLANTASGFNPQTFFLNADGVSAVLSFLNQNSDAKVISEPRAVTLDNETAHPRSRSRHSDHQRHRRHCNTTGGSQITYTNLGIILDVTPRISANATSTSR